jgi:hypothetical protein
MHWHNLVTRHRRLPALPRCRRKASPASRRARSPGPPPMRCCSSARRLAGLLVTYRLRPIAHRARSSRSPAHPLLSSARWCSAFRPRCGSRTPRCGRRSAARHHALTRRSAAGLAVLAGISFSWCLYARGRPDRLRPSQSSQQRADARAGRSRVMRREPPRRSPSQSPSGSRRRKALPPDAYFAPVFATGAAALLRSAASSRPASSPVVALAHRRPRRVDDPAAPA